MIVDWPFADLLLGSWLSVVLVFSLYNLLQGYILQETFRLTLGLLGLTIAFTDAFFYGVFDFFFPTLQQTIAPYIASVTIVVITVLASWFTRPFLRFAELIPAHNRRLALTEKLVMLPLPALLVVPPHWVGLAQMIIAPIDAYFWTRAFLAIRDVGGFGARLMALFWPAIATGAILWFARNLGLIPGSAWLTVAYMLGIALEGIAISLALSYRLKKLAEDSTTALASAEAINRAALDLQNQLRTEIDERTAELRQQERRANEEYRSKQAFLSLISHDLRGPLSSASQSISHLLLNLHAGKTQELARLLTNIDDTLIQQVSLVDRLLDIETLRTSSRNELPPTLDLHQVVASCLANWRGRFASRAMNAVNEIDRDTAIRADPLLLNTMLETLLGNALQHGSPDGVVRIGQDPHGASGFFVGNTVKDLSESSRAKILGLNEQHMTIGQPNYDEATQTADALFAALGSGRGLGLTLARGVMRARGGDLISDIDEPMVRFRVIMPTIERRVLIVDDQPLQVSALEDRLGPVLPATHFYEANDVEAALGVLANTGIDLILCDVRMPDADGFALLEAVRSKPLLEHTPLILLSAVASPAEAHALNQRAARAGADAFHAKPLNAEALADIRAYIPTATASSIHH